MSMYDGVDVTEMPIPKACPCLAVKRFVCPATERGKAGKVCQNGEYVQRCPHFSAYYWFKCAQEKSKQMEQNTGLMDPGDFDLDG